MLTHFDPKKEIVIQCYASKDGNECSLLQNKKPIAFVSRSLTKVETRYA